MYSLSMKFVDSRLKFIHIIDIVIKFILIFLSFICSLKFKNNIFQKSDPLELDLIVYVAHKWLIT